MTTVAEAFVTLRPKTDGFQQEAERGVGGPMKKIAAGIGAGFAAVKVKDFLAGAIGEARESIKVTAQSEQVIKSTGGAAHLTAKDFETLAGAISAKAGVDDEAIQSAENLLATFTNVRNEAGKGKDIFNQATQAIVDMSAVQGDLQSNSILVGKALQDPVKGVTALQRVGVKLTDQQKDQIKWMAAAGDTAGAQKVILKELGVEFGGQAAAQATAGDKLNVAWGNLQETVGKKLVPIMEKVSTFLVEHQELIGPLAVVIGGVLVAAFVAWAAAAVTAAVATLAAIAPVLLIGAVIAGLAILIIKNWDTIKAATSKAWEFVKTVTVGAFNAVKDFFVQWWPVILGIMTGGIGLIVVLIIQHWDTIKRVTSEAWNAVFGFVSSVLGKIVSGVSGAIGDVVSFFTGLPGKIIGAVTGALGRLVEIGKKIAQAIIRGLKGAIGGLADAVLDAIPGGGIVKGIVSHIPGFAEGGVVPGPLGKPILSIVHGGEEVLTPAQRGAAGDTWNISVEGRDRPRETALEAVYAFRRVAYLRGR